MKKIICLFSLLSVTFSIISYEFELIRGIDMDPFLSIITTMRLKQFAQYPYLYNGNNEIEFPLVQSFVAMEDSALLLVYDNQQIAGILTAAAMVPYDTQFDGSLKSFRDNGLCPEEYYYIAEIIIKPEYREKGLSKILFKKIEEHAKKLGYRATSLLVESHESHPLKPKNYINLNNIWIKLGYQAISAYVLSSWDTFIEDGTSKEKEHRLDYWIKRI